MATHNQLDFAVLNGSTAGCLLDRDRPRSVLGTMGRVSAGLPLKADVRLHKALQLTACRVPMT
jgi:hypothetical protein